MQALPNYFNLQSLELIIDSQPLIRTPETSVLDAIAAIALSRTDSLHPHQASCTNRVALMMQRYKCVLVKSGTEIIGYLTQQDIVQLVASGTDLKSVPISEVMQTSVIKLKMQSINSLATLSLLLSQPQLRLFLVVDEQDQLVGTISPESIYLAIKTQKECSHYQEVEEALVERLRLADFRSDIDAVLTQTESLEKMMRGCTDALVTHLDAAFARIWILNTKEQVLELQVSSGMYTHIDGNHRLIPVGQFKIGMIAQEGKPQQTNSIQNDPRISNPEWAKREGLVAFAGYPLIIEGEIIGVIAMFSRQLLTENTFRSMEIAAEEISLAIKRKQTETALRESEEYFRLLIEGVKDYAIYMLDLEGRVMSWNSGAECITGYQALEIVGHDFSCFFRGEDILNNIPKQQLDIAKDNGRCECESVFVRKDGSHFWANCILTPLSDETGKLRGFSKITRDITERKLVEEGLRLRDRAIAASSNGIIIADVTSPNSSIIYVNPAFERMTGYLAAEVMGQNFPLLHGIDINQAGCQELITAMQAGQDCTVILPNYRQDGTLFWQELNISPVYDNDGYLTHYIGIQTDITDRQQAETALVVSQQRLQYLLSSSPAVIYTCKASRKDFCAIFVSENVTAMVGYESQEFINNPCFWSSHLHPEDAPQVLAELSRASNTGQYSLEYRFLHKDGIYHWIYDQGKVVSDKAGKPLEIVGYWADITNRKQLEQELRVALEKEKELNELKSRFISMTSHEFRTPLSTILSSSELLEHYRDRWTQEKQLTHLRRIQTAVERITEMLNDILMIGKAEAGKLEYKPLPFDLIEYCRQAVKELHLNQKNQHLVSFSSEYESISCCMDDKLLGYILSNLLSNALKYSPDSTCVKFTLTSKNRQAIFEIQDQGIGIPEEDIPRLFESFHRAKNVGNILGTGLGLAIVKKCVDIHQGSIHVISEIGRGTKFTVSLPLNKYNIR